MVTLKNDRPARGQSRNILIDPEALHRARVEVGALCSKQTVGEWLEEAIEEQIKRRKEVK